VSDEAIDLRAIDIAHDAAALVAPSTAVAHAHADDFSIGKQPASPPMRRAQTVKTTKPTKAQDLFEDDEDEVSFLLSISFLFFLFFSFLFLFFFVLFLCLFFAFLLSSSS